MFSQFTSLGTGVGWGLLRGLFLSGIAAVTSAAQVPLDVVGPADKSVTADRVTLRVPSATGYSYAVQLDGRPLPTDLSIEVTAVDFHQLRVSRTNLVSGEVTNLLVRFIVRSSVRKDAEWGLQPWTPYPPIDASSNELAGAHFDVITPQDYPCGLEIPVVAWLRDSADNAVRANGYLFAGGHPSIRILRGAGSGFLASNNPAGPLIYAPQLKGVQAARTINLEASTTWSNVAGSIAGAVSWPANSRIAVTNHLAIPAGASLTIGEGSVVRLSGGVNITNDGQILVNGTVSRPVVFTPGTRAQPWGGFFMRSSTSQLDANGTIFVASGADPNAGAGHRSEQCLFLMDNHSRFSLTDCAAIYMAGQFGHGYDKGIPWNDVVITRSLIQRCITGGEWNGTSLKLLPVGLDRSPLGHRRVRGR